MLKYQGVHSTCTKVNSIVNEWQNKLTNAQRLRYIKKAPIGFSGFCYYLQKRLKQRKES